MKTILVTGASGFIGRAICRSLIKKNQIIALDSQLLSSRQKNYIPIRSDIRDEEMVINICKTYKPDIVIHCAGLAHQNPRNKKSKGIYDLVNHVSTEKLAHAAASSNPELYFIFLSSVSVYGENQKKAIISETDCCLPASPYAESKWNAEKGLIEIYQRNIIKKIDILRLAPVYDNEERINLEKRVLSPRKICYLRYGSGKQKMSALARENLMEFIEFILNDLTTGQFCRVINVCDECSYSFNEIIDVFKKTNDHSQKLVVKVPLWSLRLPISVLALLLRNYSEWIYSFYNKLAKDQVFDNKRMFDTGFIPRLSLKSVFIDSGE
jgi:nucleoside-diphosphate-sugar epimerase